MDKRAFEYAPIIYMDEKEPFRIKRVGFAAYNDENRASSSFNRRFDLGNFRGAVEVLEYTYYLDYDIQHLYDLEHIWVYLDKEGNVVGVEGSFHGRFLCAYSQEFVGAEVAENKHVVMYSQPGKHAMLAKPEFMYLYTELFSSCGRLAGIHGLDAPDRYVKDIHISEADNRKVADYIRDKYGFEPSMKFVNSEIPEADYMELSQLQEKIPEFLKAELDKLGIVYG